MQTLYMDMRMWVTFLLSCFWILFHVKVMSFLTKWDLSERSLSKWQTCPAQNVYYTREQTVCMAAFGIVRYIYFWNLDNLVAIKNCNLFHTPKYLLYYLQYFEREKTHAKIWACLDLLDSHACTFVLISFVDNVHI